MKMAMTRKMKMMEGRILSMEPPEPRPHHMLELRNKSPHDDDLQVLMRRPGIISSSNNVNRVDGRLQLEGTMAISRSSSAAAASSSSSCPFLLAGTRPNASASSNRSCCCCCCCCCRNLLLPLIQSFALSEQKAEQFHPQLMSPSSTSAESIHPSSSYAIPPSPTNNIAILGSASPASAGIISSGLYVKIRSSDMPIRMQLHAIQLTKEILDNRKQRSRSLMEAARALKQSFDDHHGYVWHCIVGPSFGSYVTHTVGTSIYFSIGKLAVLLFQTSLPPPCPSSYTAGGASSSSSCIQQQLHIH